MGKFFGTDGVRGIANDDLTPTLAFKLGMAGATVFKKKQQTTYFYYRYGYKNFRRSS